MIINEVAVLKCDECNGTGYVAIAPGVRGIRKCSRCNGAGEITTIQQHYEASASDKEELHEMLISLLTGCSLDTESDVEYVVLKLIDAGIRIIKE